MESTYTHVHQSSTLLKSSGIATDYLNSCYSEYGQWISTICITSCDKYRYLSLALNSLNQKSAV